MNNQEERAIREVLKLASIDPSFRAKAVADPKAALADVGGKNAAEIEVRFVDDAGSGLRTIVLPDPEESGLLRDEDLEQVAGGCMFQYSSSPVPPSD